MTPRMQMLPRLFAAALAATLAVPAAAQQWPTRALRIVTGTPAGGSPDFVSRLLAERLSERLGQAVLVENSATTGVAAWNTVAKSQPDGYLVSMLTGAFSARAAVAKALPYHPIKDFAFITLISGYPMVVATAPNSPLKSFPDLIARAKAAPFDVTYGMNLPGSVHHLTGELINLEAGTSLRGIPYRGNTQIVQDLLGGRLDVMIETGTIAFAQINGGMLRGLAVSSRKRFVLEPDIRRLPRRCPASRSCRGSALPRLAAPRAPSSIDSIGRSAKFSSCRTFVTSSRSSATSRCRLRPSRCKTISSVTPPAGAASWISRASRNIEPSARHL